MHRIAILSALALAACTDVGDDPDELAQFIPSEEQVRINLPTDTNTMAKSTGDWARYYVVTRVVTEDVNGMITWILGTVALVTSTQQPTWKDGETREAVWGPYQDSGLDPVSTGIYVREEDDGSHSWAVFQVPNGGDIETDAVTIVAGEVDPGSTAKDATGIFAADFTAASELDPAVRLEGSFFVEYDYDANGVAATASFQDYGTLNGPKFDALYAYDEDYAGAGEMDLAWLENVGGSSAEELLTMRSRWQEDGAGRSDATASGGDLSEAGATASECWGTDFHTDYWTDTFGLYEPEGAETDCVFASAEFASEADFSLAE